jgi:hypothetical protein
MSKNLNAVRFEVEDLPELATEVGLAGSVKQQEVGGAVCLGVAAGIAIWVAQV